MAKSKTSTRPTVVPAPTRANQEQNIAVRKIHNGYIARHTTYPGDNGMGIPQTKEVYHPSKPKITVGVPGKKK